jgi:hypothetical protein
LDSLDSGVVVSILAIAESIIAVCIALTFIHFKYFKSVVLDQILLELNLITEYLGGDSVVEAAAFSGIVGGASAVAPIVIVTFFQAYVNVDTIIISAIGIYATLLTIFAQICKVILVAKICRELFKRINSQLKVNGINTVSNTNGNYLFGFQSAAASPSKNTIQLLLDLRRVHSEISAVMELTDCTFRTSILLSTIYCTFDMIFGIFYPLAIVFKNDDIPPQYRFKTFLMIVVNISYVLGVAILYIWFSWQCEEAVEEVIFCLIQPEILYIDPTLGCQNKRCSAIFGASC